MRKARTVIIKAGGESGKSRLLSAEAASRFVILLATFVLAIGVLSAGAEAEAATSPLEPPDTSSPRATISTLISAMDRAYSRWSKGEGRTYQNLAEREAAVKRWARCFDLEDVAPVRRGDIARETSVYLKEIFDRIELPPMSEIPDAAAIAALPGGLDHWRIPHTEFVLVRVKGGVQDGQYVFSSETDEYAREAYFLVRHMPYKPGSSEGLYEFYVSEPGWMIPQSWVHALPGWAKVRLGDQTVWQWFSVLATLLAAGIFMFAMYRLGARFARLGKGVRYYISLLCPILAMSIPTMALYFLEHGVFLTGKVLVVMEFSLHLISLIALVVVIMSVSDRLANGVASLRWFQSQAVNAQLVQLVIRSCGVIGAVVALLEGGQYIGVPLTTLIAGVSVGGLAVALAAQDALKNLFGSLMIILDKPFDVGDHIKIKGYEGVVKMIGLRSTKLRLPSGHIVTIPNEEMARLDSENISRRLHLRRSEVLHFKADTPPQKIRRAVEIIREALKDHAGMEPQFPPTVNAGSFGSDAVNITMTYWFHPPDQARFEAFNEDLNMRLLTQFQAEEMALL